MNNSATQIPTDNSTYHIPEAALDLISGPQWLHKMRQTARKVFNDTPLPQRGLALWRYTNPESFLVDHNQMVGAQSCEGCNKTTEEVRQQFNDGNLAGLAIDCCGRDIEIQTGPDAEQGLVILPLSVAMDTHEKLIQKHFGQLVGSDTGKFEALNTALWHDGIFVYVPDNTTIENPVHLLRYGDGAKTTYYPRLLIVLDNNAQLTLIDEYSDGSVEHDNGYAYVNGAVEIFGAKDSRCNYIPLQQHTSSTRIYLNHRTRIEQGASTFTIPLVFGSGLSKENFGVYLDGSGAESNIYGVLFGSGHQQFDNHTLHHHRASKTLSNIDFKVVLRDRAVSAYTGLIRIDQNAVACEAYQGNRNLLLNEGTRAETIPELEILNEDVQCSHGATVGPVDPEMVFFLTARGINREEAIRMIVSGFIEGTLSHIPNNLQERISNIVQQRLEVN
ncbi:MAG: Fe-S cluster assembly protein SufD [Candidatus Zixiibacteriota bacterium]|nr:MAG: Fe-S cluster assembly protein SufD [candidate division Zixibacteria bacterium]